MESVKSRVIEQATLGRIGNKADGHTLLTNQQPCCRVAYCVPRKVHRMLQPGCYLAIKWACFLTEPSTMRWWFCSSAPFQVTYLFSIWRNGTPSCRQQQHWVSGRLHTSFLCSVITNTGQAKQQ